jgi:hypothetical protein
MQGVPFRVDGQGRVLISWMSRNQAYWSLSEAGAKRFRGRVPSPDRKPDEAFPVAVANQQGEVLLVWKQGKAVHWALYHADGRFTGQRGKAGELPGTNKPTAVIGADNVFYVVF